MRTDLENDLILKEYPLPYFLERNRLVIFIERYNGLGEKLFTYRLRWNKEGTRSAYKVTFHKNMIITQLDSILFANPASEIRTNWVADFKSIKDGRPKSVSVYDELGSKYYNYKFYFLESKCK